MSIMTHNKIGLMKQINMYMTWMVIYVPLVRPDCTHGGFHIAPLIADVLNFCNNFVHILEALKPLGQIYVYWVIMI